MQRLYLLLHRHFAFNKSFVDLKRYFNYNAAQ